MASLWERRLLIGGAGGSLGGVARGGCGAGSSEGRLVVGAVVWLHGRLRGRSVWCRG